MAAAMRGVIKRIFSAKNFAVNIGTGEIRQEISGGLQPDVREAIDRLTAELRRHQIRKEIPEQAFLESLQKPGLIDPREEVAALPDRSNITPSANALRIAAKEAMGRNAIAEALGFIQQADDIEARAEAAALRKAEKLEFELQDARTMAVAQSVSRAETQSAHAAILYDLNDFDGAKRLYESAIQRLPSSEKELRQRNARKLRITLNNIAARTSRRALIRPLLFESAFAAPPDVASYSILIRRAPDYQTAREVLDEMTAAGIAPNVVSFNSLIAAAPDYQTAREVLGEMTAAGIAPDVVSFSSLIAAAPDYKTAREVLGEMTAAGIPPNVVSFSSLIAAAPDYKTAREVLGEMTAAGIAPDVVSFNSLIAAAPDYQTAREVLGEMTAAGIAPNVVSFNSLIAAAPDYKTAREVLGEMTAAGIAPNVVSFSSLIAAAPDYKTAREVLGEMTAAGIAPNVRTSTIVAGFVESRDQASELRTLLRTYFVAGGGFHSAVYTKLCKQLDAKELLDWAFSGGGGAPFGAFETAIANYRRQGKLADALRVASAFPHFPACRKTFREETAESVEYLTRRFRDNEEPQNAAYALGIYYKELGQVPKAVEWFTTALEHPQTADGKKVYIRKDLEDLTNKR